MSPKYFVLRDMQLYLSEYTHTIRFEWDGYPIDFTKWTDDFLDYDLLAQPLLTNYFDGNRYGLMGGMSIRSKKAADKLREIATLDWLNNYYKKKYFFDAGQFYLANLSTWKKFSNIHKNGHCIKIPEWRTVDINYPSDWKKAEAIFRYLNNVSR